ncbi:predicted protein [Naegleria gruberi]|uniref:Predicted protein n=1 Tax=Naegleria gruberi TaxID=5762 RepID=D2VS07_NAEGR|nr:uncharacterized protein NAEGRDRAFT_51797 [Naegleria gruberi]EFC40265.1 predicted protein [Naegleria gruberi]|eukprot:XP_002673009.1 predicted protein [Naegleria gruberi strain NEG-M]
MMTSSQNIVEQPTRPAISSLDIPTNYTLTTDPKYMNCTQLHKIRDQSQCAACYAFGVAEMVADRYCISSQGKVNTILSPQFILSCDEYEGNCYGGDIGNTLLYVKNYGIVTDSCLPFLARNGSNLSCPNKCLDGSNWKLRYKVKNPNQIAQDDIQGMQQSILQGGSIIAAFQVYEDFAHYKGGIYVHTGGAYIGGHVVKIVGFGETPSGIPYWVVANR